MWSVSQQQIDIIWCTSFFCSTKCWMPTIKISFIILYLSVDISIRNEQCRIIIIQIDLSDLPNLLLITPSAEQITPTRSDMLDETFSLLTSKFQELPTDNWLLKLDTFNSATRSFQQNANLFPEKMHNLHGRPVHVSMFNYQPYMIIEEVVSSQTHVVMFRDCHFLFSI